VSFQARWRYPHGDPSVKLWDYCVQRGWIDLPKGASVLELGCCETDWHKWMRNADPDLDLVGVDVNECGGYSGQFFRADVNALNWNLGLVSVSELGNPDGPYLEDHRFDAVVGLGSIEHFGLGFYGDPLNDTADIEAVCNASDWLKPGGFLYYDVPWSPVGYRVTDNRHFRVYDDRALQDRLTPPGMVVERQAWAAEHPQTPVGLIDERPAEEAWPFWYCIRILRKSA
jgi:SAM-dependent methyltransferase